MTDPETSFSIEVLRFPRDADPEVIAAGLAEYFSISLDDGRRLVRKVPVRVKRNAPAALTQQLVKQLRRLGADVLVRNEQTGEERTYRPGQPTSRPREPDPARESGLVSLPPPAQPPPPDDTLESEDHDSPLRNGVYGPTNGEAAHEGDKPLEHARVHVLRPYVPDGSAQPESEPWPEEPDLPPPPRAPSSQRTPPASNRRLQSQPRLSPVVGEGRTGLSLPPSDIPPRSSDHGQRPLTLPPPSGPGAGQSVPPGRGALEYCTACKGPLEKGEICARCGWSNSQKQRHCRQCKKKLALVSSVSKRPVLIIAILAASLAVAAAAFMLFGVSAAVAALLCGAAVGVLTDGLTLRFACKSCPVGVYSERLQKEEQTRLEAGRRRSFIIATFCGLAAGALFLVPSGPAGKLSAASYGMAWTIQVPSSHSRIDSEVAMVQLPTGQKRMRVQSAQKPLFPGSTLLLANVQYTNPGDPAPPDKVGVAATLEQLVKVVFSGSLTGTPAPAGESLQADFTGTFHGKPVHGRARATQYEHDMLVLVVLSPSADGARDGEAEKFLTSLQVERASR